MCGVFGLVYPTTVKYDQQKFIEQATFVGTLRGVDSTGLALVDKDNNVDTFKRALAGPDFATSSVGQRAFDALKSSFVAIGHNRAATRGVVKDYTAHPFTFGTITGCHNGTLEYNHGLDVKKHPVDSMNLLDSLSQVGNAPSAKKIAEFLETVRGSFALTWYDAETEMMWFARNDQRPLAYFEDDKGLYWASEIGMLGWLGFRNKLLKNMADLKLLAPNKLVGYNTRDMKFVEEAKFSDPKVLTTSGGAGGTRGTGTYGRKNEPPFFYAPEAGMRVQRLQLDDAIAKKVWNKEDEEVFAVFDKLKDQPNMKSSGTKQLYGTAYLSQGEYVPFVCWAPVSREIDINQIYTAKVASLMVSEKDRKVIPRIVLAGNTFDLLDEDATSLGAQLAEEAYFDLSKPGGGICFQGPEGDGDQGEVTESKEETGKNVIPITTAKGVDEKEGLFRGPLGNRIDGELFDALVEEGCHHCAAEITRKDSSKMAWLFGNAGAKAVCPGCVEIVKRNEEAYGIQSGALLTQ